MKNLNALFFVLLAVFIVLSSVDAIAQEKKDMKIVKMAGLKWEQVPEAPEGLMMAVVWGNPEKEAYGMYVKFPAGMKFPLHYHTNNSKTLLVSGKLTVLGEDGKRYEAGPGDYGHVPAEWKHTTEVGPDGAILFEWSNEPADIVMVEGGGKGKK